MLRINKIEIQGIGPIKELELSFNDHMNIICGTNGIGKTTILNCVAQTFAFNNFSLRKNGAYDCGKIKTTIYHNGIKGVKVLNVNQCRPQEKADFISSVYQLAENVIFYKPERTLSYINVSSINKDPELGEYVASKQTVSGSLYDDIKRWFINRYLWSKHPNTLNKKQVVNLQLAINIINQMCPGISFKKLDHETFDIILESPQGEFVLEQLSSGYIAYIIVLWGLIKDIEYRFKKPHINVMDFDGILIIDEIDEHMHPSLQSKMYHELKAMLPKAQIFTSTHSPHILQAAEPAEIIPLIRCNDNNVRINPLNNIDYGFKGWSIEEILTDVMGMTDTKSNEYKHLDEEFKKAIEDEDSKRAHEIYNELIKMLHPNNILRKVLEIQLANVPEV